MARQSQQSAEDRRKYLQKQQANIQQQTHVQDTNGLDHEDVSGPMMQQRQQQQQQSKPRVQIDWGDVEADQIGVRRNGSGRSNDEGGIHYEELLAKRKDFFDSQVIYMYVHIYIFVCVYICL